MLRTLPSPEIFKNEMRHRVCRVCPFRPPHTEALGPQIPRRCEAKCPLFLHLPMLRKIALLTDPMLRSRRWTLQQWVGRLCEEDPRLVSGPLNRNLDRALDTVSRLLHEH